MKDFIGYLSGFLVVLSIGPYAVRVYQKKIIANLVSWSIWSFIGLSLLLTYRSSGATSNIWPSVFGFSNPCLITVLLFWRGEKKRPNLLEVVCITVATMSIILWWFVRDSKDLSPYALYLAMLADVCAGVPIAVYDWKNPKDDRPFMWLLFGLGYGLTIFAIEEKTFSNYILPTYMTVMCTIVSFPLIRYRIREKMPIKEWI